MIQRIDITENLQCLLDIAERDAREAADCGEEEEAAEKRAVINRIRMLVLNASNLFFALYDIVDDIQKGRTEWETNGTLACALDVLAKVKSEIA